MSEQQWQAAVLNEDRERVSWLQDQRRFRAEFPDLCRWLDTYSGPHAVEGAGWLWRFFEATHDAGYRQGFGDGQASVLPWPDCGSGSRRPTVVCLCGSTRFHEAFRKANFNETLAGRIVLTLGCDMRSDDDLFGDMEPAEQARIKARLDELHLRKIDLADEILVLNCGQYIGESTARELAYARQQGKWVRFLEPEVQP